MGGARQFRRAWPGCHVCVLSCQKEASKLFGQLSTHVPVAMSAPKVGRVFLRSHRDCFIHATASIVKYWNFSLAQVGHVYRVLLFANVRIQPLQLQEGLGIVKVTVGTPREHVFLACISPLPLPYEHVPEGVHHRDYLEVDPKFAAEMGITQDTEVSTSMVSVILT